MTQAGKGGYPDVSVIIPTMNSERYLGTLLDHLSPHFREITVGVDTKSNKETHDCAVSHGCNVIWVDNPEIYPETMLEPMLEQCGNDWILRLDDDELISLRLVAFMKEILPALDVDAVGIHRKWCRVGRSGKLEYSFYPKYGFDWPWRLFRKERVRLLPVIHSAGIEFSSETKAPLEAFIVHLDWIYHSYEERKAKVERYMAVNPALGFEEYYLYEDLEYSNHYFTPLWEEEFKGLAGYSRRGPGTDKGGG